MRLRLRNIWTLAAVTALATSTSLLADTSAGSGGSGMSVPYSSANPGQPVTGLGTSPGSGIGTTNPGIVAPGTTGGLDADNSLSNANRGGVGTSTTGTNAGNGSLNTGNSGVVDTGLNNSGSTRGTGAYSSDQQAGTTGGSSFSGGSLGAGSGAGAGASGSATH